jgi:DNA-directed RNA polymerase specialized sigma subunit
MKHDEEHLDKVSALLTRKPDFHTKGHELHRQWSSLPDDHEEKPQALSNLLDHYNPTRNNLVQKYRGPNVNEAAMHQKAKELFVTAFERWDPSRNASLDTFLHHQGKSLSRFNTERNDVARKVEDVAQAIGPLLDFKQNFQDTHGKAPTSKEIAAGMGHPLHFVTRVIREAGKREAPGSAFEGTTERSLIDPNDEKIQLLLSIPAERNPLNHRSLEVLKYMQGHERPAITRPGEIARTMGLSQSQVSKALKAINTALKEHE